METRLRIGAWVLHPDRHRLERDGTGLRLEPRLVQLLLALAERPGRVWSREELDAKVWSDVHVTRDALPNAVYELRRALGDDARRPRYVETVPKRGYRLVAGVSALPSGPATPGPGRRLLAAALALGVVLAGSRSLTDPAGHVARDAHESFARVAAGAEAEAPGLESAEHDARRALALDPRDAEAHAVLGRVALAQWQWDVARRALDRALELDPGSARAHGLRAQLLLLAGRGPEARAAADTSVERAPGSPRVLLAAAEVHAIAGGHAEAEALYTRILDRWPGHGAALAGLAKLRGRSRAPAPRALLPRLDEVLAKGELRPALVAALFAEAGDRDRAARWLERAVAARDTALFLVQFDERWPALRRHPGYRRLLEERGPERALEARS